MSDSSASIQELLAHAGWLRGLARRLAGEAGADDLVQEVWLKATKRPPGRVESPRGWLRAALHSVHFRRLDRAAAARRREREVAVAERLPSAAELTGRAEAQRRLVEAVLALDDPNRRALLLHFFEGHSAAEIARRDGEPESTVRNRVARGLEQLRRRLDDRPGGRDSWMPGMLLLAAPERGAATVAALSLGSLAVWKAALAVLLVALIVWIGSGQFADRGPAPPSSVDGVAVLEVSDVPPVADVRPRQGSETTRSPAVEHRPSAAPAVIDDPAPAAVASETGPAVAGRVFDPTGRPVAGAVVYEGTHAQVTASLGNEFNTRRASAITDEDGDYRLELKSLAGAVVSARAEGFASSPEIVIDLANAALAEGVDHHLRVGATVAGVVYGLDDRPVAGREVQLASPNLAEFRRLSTDSEGRFEASALIPGTWRVATFPDKAELAAAGEATDEIAGMAFLNQEEFLLIEGETYELALGLVSADSPRVTGRLLLDGEPIEGLMQWYPAARPTEKNMVQSRPDGTFAVDLPEAGAWVAHANLLGLSSRGQRHSLDLAPGAVEELVIDLRGATLRGRVVDVAGEPVDGARVELRTVGRAPHQPPPTLGGDSANTEADGRFAFVLLETGDYVVVVHGSGERASGAPQAGAVSAPVSVEGDGETVLDDLVVHGGGTIEITVADATGRPSSGASLYFHDMQGRPLNPSTMTRSSGGGGVTSPTLPLGPVWVTATRVDGVSSSERVEVGVDTGVELVLGPDHWIEIAAEDGVIDPTRGHVSVTDEAGRRWGGLVDVRRLFAAKPERDRPERPLFGPLPPGSYTLRVELDDGVLAGALTIDASSPRVSTALVR